MATQKYMYCIYFECFTKYCLFTVTDAGEETQEKSEAENVNVTDQPINEMPAEVLSGLSSPTSEDTESEKMTYSTHKKADDEDEASQHGCKRREHFSKTLAGHKQKSFKRRFLLIPRYCISLKRSCS